LEAAERKQKGNDGEKGDGSTTTRRYATRRIRSHSEPIKHLPKHWTRSFRHHRLGYLVLPYEPIGVVLGAAPLPPNDVIAAPMRRVPRDPTVEATKPVDSNISYGKLSLFSATDGK
jgi:hypothetical protein